MTMFWFWQYRRRALDAERRLRDLAQAHDALAASADSGESDLARTVRDQRGQIFDLMERINALTRELEAEKDKKGGAVVAGLAVALVLLTTGGFFAPAGKDCCPPPRHEQLA